MFSLWHHDLQTESTVVHAVNVSTTRRRVEFSWVELCRYKRALCHSRSLKVIGNGTIRQITCDFLLAFHSNYGPILYNFRDKARYWSTIFRTPCIRRPVRGSPSKYCLNVWHWNTRMVWLLDGEKVCTFKLFDTIPAWQTDILPQRTCIGRAYAEHRAAKTWAWHIGLRMQTDCKRMTYVCAASKLT